MTTAPSSSSSSSTASDQRNRLERYYDFISSSEYGENLLRFDEYSLEMMQPSMSEKIKSGQFTTYLFMGMGCSAVVSFVLRGFFADLFKAQLLQQKTGKESELEVDARKLPFIETANDYDLEYWTDMEKLTEGKTLVVLASYSGYSTEPFLAYEKFRNYTDNIVFLTTGGNLLDLAKRDNVSMILYKIKRVDREYPLFHVPQYFAILLDFFYKMGVLPTNYQPLFADLAPRLILSRDRAELARHMGRHLIDRNIILLTTSKWHAPLSHTFDMHFNEIAMAPCHTNYIHEFSHSEVATISEPYIKHAVIIFREETEDSYTTNKINNILNLFSNTPNVASFVVTMKKTHYIEQFFDILLFVQHVVYHLGNHYAIRGRDLISLTTGNSYYAATANRYYYLPLIKKQKANL